MCLRVVDNDYSDHKKHLLAKTITIHTVGNAVKDMWIGLNDLMLHRRRGAWSFEVIYAFS